MTSTNQNQPPVTGESGEFISPRVDIFENQDAYLLQAEMPGVNKDSLEVSVNGSELTIIGRRVDAAPTGQALHRESRAVTYRYQRGFELDPSVDGTHIQATIAQGILSLRLPKAKKAAPKKIEVKE